MFWRMIARTLVRQKGKMLMIAFTIVLGVSLSTAMMNVMLGVGDKVNRELKVYGANINVRHKEAALMNDLYGLSEGLGVMDKFLFEEDVLKLKSIFWGFNIVDFAPILEGRAAIDGIGPVPLIGTWMAKHADLNTGEAVDTGLRALRNWWQIDLKGDWIGERDDDYVMVGSLLAGRANIKVGDKISLFWHGRTREVTVKGVFNDGGAADEQIFGTLRMVQEMMMLPGKVSNIEVSALTTPDNDLARKAAQDPKSLSPEEYETWYCTAYVSAICHQIQEVVRNGVAKPVRQVAESEGTILNKTTLLMILITILSSIGSALAISNLITASVIERSQELGLLKALGAHNWQISLLVLVEVMLTGLFGGVLGYFLGIGFAQVIGQTVFGSYIEIAQMVIPILGVILFFVTLFGSIPAIRYLMALKPTEVLHGK
ncbi:ABC transporter permease [Synergistes jonesii]|uniref:ABC transporter permease n=1 Tax=Synergistes jonesii TaxID=2754 RepID=A0A073IS50_9BACT|nr:ABC transporter permease [Synergistes jonesii]KEJ92311.1 ABC transporter permease [Synergistes jonesii]OFB62756.1 ABC transporter permease [Synergistes jonesii]OFB63463.1 ABC transporter permease [Synergistes jonesii]OFB65494.1 ABC transporter permease [Synergistes jonesii]OFB67701.1 ABC transporter permease [Synergistes jonesii]